MVSMAGERELHEMIRSRLSQSPKHVLVSDSNAWIGSLITISLFQFHQRKRNGSLKPSDSRICSRISAGIVSGS